MSIGRLVDLYRGTAAGQLGQPFQRPEGEVQGGDADAVGQDLQQTGGGLFQQSQGEDHQQETSSY